MAVPAAVPFLGGGAFLGGLGMDGGGLGPILGHDSVLSLQRTAGNQSVSGLMLRGQIRFPGVARQPAAPPAPPPSAPGSTSAPGPAGQTPKPPTRADPSSGIDWDAFWSGDSPNAIRTVLEVMRLYPGWGLLAGGVADLMNAKQDFTVIKGQDAPEIESAMAVRHAIAITNNAVGHVAYVNQLVQDILALSVVGAEFTPVTATLNEILLSVKVTLDGAQFMMDFGLTCAAKYKSMTAPPGKAQDAWNSMVANYEANLVGDLVGGVFDVLDLATAGVSNSQPAKSGAKALKATFDVAKLVKGLIRSVLQGWFGVWGGKLFEQGKDSPLGGASLGRVVERQAADVILTELMVMKSTYMTGDLMIEAAGAYIAKQLADLDQVARIVTGGKDPFVMVRDAAVEGLGDLEERVADLGQMQALSGTAKEKADSVREFCDDAVGTIDTLTVPTITLPKVEVGEGVLADLAEAAANQATAIANAAIEGLMAELREAVDGVKSDLKAPIETVKTHADDLGKFMQIVVDEAKAQIAATQAKVADVRGKLAQCNSIEDVIDMIIKQVFEMVGLSSDFKIDDIRQFWKDLGPMIDDAILWAQALRDGTPAPPPREKVDEEDDPPPTPAGVPGASRTGGAGAGAAGGGSSAPPVPAAAGGGSGSGRGGGASRPAPAAPARPAPAAVPAAGGAGAGATAPPVPAPAPSAGGPAGGAGGSSTTPPAAGGPGYEPWKPGEEPSKLPAGDDYGMLGGMLGGAAGAALGGGIGSMLGGMGGGLAGSALGGVLGGGIGSMLGEGLDTLGDAFGGPAAGAAASAGGAALGGLAGAAAGAGGAALGGLAGAAGNPLEAFGMGPAAPPSASSLAEALALRRKPAAE